MPTLILAALTLHFGVLQDRQGPAPIPMQRGVTIVQAVSGDGYQGRDYEPVITIGSADTRGVTLTSTAFVKDRAGERRWLTVQRTVPSADMGGARTLILGFDTEDPERLPGTTAIGPSRLILEELGKSGRAMVTVKRHPARPAYTGTLERIESGTVSFPVLVNGVRVALPVIHARGQLRTTGSLRPWEFWFFDHPTEPLTLRAMYGAEGQHEANPPEWSRQIVRIDVPGIGPDWPEPTGGRGSGELEADSGEIAAVAMGGTPHPGDEAGSGGGSMPDIDASAGGGAGGSAGAGNGTAAGSGAGSGTGPGAGAGAAPGTGAGLGGGAGGSLERGLDILCRVPVPGIYFEFDSDVLNPASGPWIRSIAGLLSRHPDWTVTIEGHTDSIGSAGYNLDLSSRRAAALKQSLVTEQGIAAARLSTRGFGPNRPLESNATVEGRARNRRVELVRPCDQTR